MIVMQPLIEDYTLEIMKTKLMEKHEYMHMKAMIYSFSCVKMPPKISDEKIHILVQVVQANQSTKNSQTVTNWEKVIS